MLVDTVFLIHVWLALPVLLNSLLLTWSPWFLSQCLFLNSAASDEKHLAAVVVMSIEDADPSNSSCGSDLESEQLGHTDTHNEECNPTVSLKFLSRWFWSDSCETIGPFWRLVWSSLPTFCPISVFLGLNTVEECRLLLTLLVSISLLYSKASRLLVHDSSSWLSLFSPESACSGSKLKLCFVRKSLMHFSTQKRILSQSWNSIRVFAGSKQMSYSVTRHSTLRKNIPWLSEDFAFWGLVTLVKGPSGSELLTSEAVSFFNSSDFPRMLLMSLWIFVLSTRRLFTNTNCKLLLWCVSVEIKPDTLKSLCSKHTCRRPLDL